MKKSSIQVTRIEKILYQDLLLCAGYLGRVDQIYLNGFDLLRKDGRLIYFCGGRWLSSPFGAVLNQSVGKWAGEVSLKEGDHFYQNRRVLEREPNEGCSIELNSANIVDLKRTLSLSPPESHTLLSWVKGLIEEILKRGNFEGVSGTLMLLNNDLPELFSEGSIPETLWSRRALPRVTRLTASIINQDPTVFEEAYEDLLGLGPGLTPAGDDLFLGILAAHKLFSSSFSGKLENAKLKRRLSEKAKAGTSSVAFQFLSYAFDGIFSETLYRVFEDLNHQSKKNDPGGRCPRKNIRSFLKWGHSSGTDTLTGIVFGLWTMMDRRPHHIPR